MFKNLRTGTKLFILCAAFVISVGVPVCALVMEKRIAIDFARKELVGSRYVATLREVCAAILAFRARSEAPDRLRASGEASSGNSPIPRPRLAPGSETSELAQALAAALRELWATRRRKRRDRCAGPGCAGEGAQAGPAHRRRFQSGARSGSRQLLPAEHRRAPDADLSRPAEPAAACLRGQHRAGRSRQACARCACRSSRACCDRRQTRSRAASRLRERGNPEGGLDRAHRSRDRRDDLEHELLSRRLERQRTADSMPGTGARTTAIMRGPWRRRSGPGQAPSPQLDRLLQRRIDGLVGRMWLGLALIGAFAGVSFCIAALTHRHIVRPLQRLEAVACDGAGNQGLRSPCRIHEPGRDRSRYGCVQRHALRARRRARAGDAPNGQNLPASRA